MFQVNDRVNCVCPGLGVPATTEGIIKEGPHSTFEGNIYRVFFPGHGILVVPETCLRLSNSANVASMASLKSVKVISKNARVKAGTKGVITSEPQMLFGRVMFDVLFEGQSSTIRLAESSIAPDVTE